MKKIITIIFIIHYSLLTVDCSAQWLKQNSNTSVDLYRMYFTGKDTCYIATYGGKILKTINGGTNWDILYQNSSIQLFASLYFLNLNTGFVIGNTYINPSAILYKTNDAGTNWFPFSNISTNEFLSDITFLKLKNGKDSIGFIVGNNGTIFKTNDYCNTWNVIYQNPSFSFIKISFRDSVNGFIVGVSWSNGDGIILKTSDSGNNWIPINSGVKGELRDISFVNDSIYYIAAETGILKTYDSSNNWALQKITPSNNKFESIFFINKDTGFTCNRTGQIFKTTDGGNNWHSQYSGTSEDLFWLRFTDNNTGYISGFGGTILKTTNGGEWIEELRMENRELRIYPNPVSVILNIKYQILNKSKAIVQIFDLFGQEIIKSQLKNNVEQIDVSYLNQGVYIVKITDNKTILVTKIIKE